MSEDLAPLDLSQPIRVHVVGAGGAGMSAIAAVLAAMGHTVTGSDLKPSPVIDRLKAAGIDVTVGHDAANVGDADVVTVSTAIRDDNPEVVEAARRGIPVYRRSHVLAAIAALRRCIAVAGTHGKTTTASMLALMLVEAGLRPSFLIGGDVNEIGTNAVWDDGEWLVVEADESDGTFLSLRARHRRGHQRRAGPSRSLRLLRGHADGLRSFLPGGPPAGGGRRRCRGAGPGPGPRGRNRRRGRELQPSPDRSRPCRGARWRST